MSNKPKKSKGVILDSLALTWKNLWGILKIVIFFYILLSLSALAVLYIAKGVGNISIGSMSGISIAAVLTIAFITLLIQSFTDSAAIKLVHESIQGNKITMRSALKATWKKKWRIVGAAILMGLITLLAGFIATFIYVLLSGYMGQDGSIFGMFLSVVVSGFAMILISFVIPEIMIQEKSVFKAIKDSIRLLFTTDGKVILKVLALMIVSFVVIVAANYLRVIPIKWFVAIAPYIVVLIGQLSLVFMEVGKVVIFDQYN